MKAVMVQTATFHPLLPIPILYYIQFFEPFIWVVFIFLNGFENRIYFKLLSKKLSKCCTQNFFLLCFHFTCSTLDSFFPLQQKRCWLRNTSRTAAQLHARGLLLTATEMLSKEKRNITLLFPIFICNYFMKHCFICRPSDFTVSEDAG